MLSTHRKTSGHGLNLVTGILLSLLAMGSVAVAADNSHPMRFGHLSINDGLSQSNVLAVLQDSDGFMWFATENGLNSYDGYEFRHYKRDRGNPEALGNDFIFDVAEGKDGSLWLATNGGGLANLDRHSGVVRTYRHDVNDAGSIASNVVRRLHVDNDNNGRLYEQMMATAFVAHPYQFPVIGWPSDIEGWTQDDLESHYRTYYAPNNCTMVFSGAVSPEEIFLLAEQYFAPIPRQNPPPPVRTIELAKTGHGFRTREDSIKYYKALRQFLLEHIGR